MNIDGLLQGVLLKHPSVPAVYAAVLQHGRLVASGAAGVRKADGHVAALPGDSVYLTDQTKPFTGVLVAGLVQAHHLAWSDTVGTLFPELRPGMNAAASRITVADLLQDRAGLPKDADWAALDATGQPVVQQRRSLVRQALSAEPVSPVGRPTVFSNVGYVILGAIVERKVGVPWEQAVSARIFRPLGMASAGFGVPGSEWTTAQPWGHRPTGGRPDPSHADDPPVLGPAGRVHCTLADWGRFVAVFCRTPGDGVPQLLSAQTLAALTTPADGGTYAGGWFRQDRAWAGGPELGVTGYNDLWSCQADVAPARGLAVLTVVNCGGDEAKAACGDASDVLIRQVAPAPAEASPARIYPRGPATRSVITP